MTKARRFIDAGERPISTFTNPAGTVEVFAAREDDEGERARVRDPAPPRKRAPPKKRKAPRRRKAQPLAKVLPPGAQVYTPAGDPRLADRIYVPLPLPPDVVLAVREHYDTGAKLWDMFSRIAEIPPGDLVATLRAACEAVDRDVKRLRRVAANAKRKRARRS